MPRKHIIFDFDGTIANTIEKGRQIYNQLAPDYSARQVEISEINQLRGLSLPEILKELSVGKLQVPSLLAKGTKTLKAHIHEIPLIPGIRHVLPEIAEIAESCGILTSNSRENVQLFLEENNIAHLFAFTNSTSKLTGKARHLRSICRTFSCSPTDLIYIGDEVRDVKACRKAGVPIVAVTWGFNTEKILRESAPDHLATTPAELISLLRQLSNP